MINGELIVDNFAGGGGASTGIELATGKSVDIAINHDPEAIRMHKANHPNTKHYCEDVWQVDPVKACKGHPVGLAWFSPDCKHFSKAKGGKPKDKFIRGLAWVACRWAGLVRPRVIMLENVEEFKTWGQLNRGHHPIKAKQGKTFGKFVQQLQDLGYEVQFRELVAADYGAPTMRKRFFMIARCDGHPIIWPEPTHAPRDSEEVKAGLLNPDVGAYTQIDFSRPCPSIFDTSQEIKEKYGIRAVRPLAPKTMERIARGLKKFVLDNPEPFIIQCNHGGKRRPNDIREPMPTITGKHGYGIVEPKLTPYLSVNRENHFGSDMREPVHTITANNQHMLMTPTLIQYHSETAKVIDITDKLNFEESPAITIKGQVYKVNDSAETMLKLMGLFDDRPETEAVPAAYELLFSEEDRERLKGLNLNFKDFMTLIEEAMDLVRGGDDDTPSGE